MRPKKPVGHTMSILAGRKRDFHTYVRSSVIPYLIGTTFVTEVPARKGSLHTKFKESHHSLFRDTNGQSFGVFSSLFSSTSFRTLCKICYKMQMHTLIKQKFCTLKGLIKANLSAKCDGNPIKHQSCDQLFT